MNNNSRPRSLSVGGGERNRQYNPDAIPLEMAPPMHYFSAPPSSPFTSHLAGLYQDPLDDVLRSLTDTYTTNPFLPPQHQYPQSQPNEPGMPVMSPQQQLDPTALAWLQFLQSQAPAQSDLGVGASSKTRGDIQSQAEQSSVHQTHSDDPVDPEEEDDSETERTATAEDKRRRNTAASARFRNKKKQWLLNMERTVTSLSRQVDELEREAADLRRENGWLKEIVMLRARRVIGGGPVNLSGTHGDKSDSSQLDAGKGKQRKQ